MHNQTQYKQADRSIFNCFSPDSTQTILWTLSSIEGELGDRIAKIRAALDTTQS